MMQLGHQPIGGFVMTPENEPIVEKVGGVVWTPEMDDDKYWLG